MQKYHDIGLLKWSLGITSYDPRFPSFWEGASLSLSPVEGAELLGVTFFSTSTRARTHWLSGSRSCLLINLGACPLSQPQTFHSHRVKGVGRPPSEKEPPSLSFQPLILYPTFFFIPSTSFRP
jgi:hypothetical protein